MCGRYTIRELRLLDAALGALLKHDDYVPPYRTPTFNAAPSQLLPVAYLDDKGKRIVEAMKWGFVPSWTKGKPKFAPINAVSETAPKSGMFRKAFAQRRCLILADGFYEPRGPKTKNIVHGISSRCVTIRYLLLAAYGSDGIPNLISRLIPLRS